MKRLMLLMAVGLGYVLGARAGRERYDQIMSAFLKVTNDPRVQEKAHRAVDLAKDQAPVMADKVTTVAGAAAAKVKRSDDSDNSDDSQNGVPHMAGPQGDLP
jgi:hypothetical protein